MNLTISRAESRIISKYPKDQQAEALLNLRFEVWLKYNNLKPDALSKVRMRQAYRAGAAMGMQNVSWLNKLKGVFFKVKIK